MDSWEPRSRRRRATAPVTTVAVAALLTTVFAVATPADAAAPPPPSQVGSWTKPFAEPTIDGIRTKKYCLEGHAQPGDQHDGKKVTCKPAATSLAVLGDKDLVYWDGLEDTEEVETSIVLEYGAVSINDQVRRLDLANRRWKPSTPPDADMDPDGNPPNELLPGAQLASKETYNDSPLFCAALTFLPDGSVMTVGGTTYYNEPDLPGKYGVVELQGSTYTRIYQPDTNSWTRVGDMHWGRWYPTLVPLADGRPFVAGGVGKLMKPVYTDGRRPTDSMRNVVQTETFDPSSGQWVENPPSADKSLPLYPRLHLLPNGDVYYNAAGQVFNPFGQAYDEATWNLASAYDPSTQSWTNLGLPGVGTPAPGFRGSTFSIMLPLKPDTDGRYHTASFLTAGGILGPTPGTYVAITDGRIDTVDTDNMSLSSTSTGSLNQPRWYGNGVLTPTGEVMVFSGASADEVVGPGTAIPVKTPELWNPETGTWTELAPQTEARTYHNTGALLPDGRIIVGGHDPISTLYLNNRTLVPGVTTPNETRNPTFEIYSPPYLFRGGRPVIEQAPTAIRHGETFDVTLKGDTSDVSSVVLMRRTTITHLVDGGQRSVELPVVARHGHTLTLAAPPRPAVAPIGPYMLFVNRKTADGPVPSRAALIDVRPGGAAPVTDGAGHAAAPHGAASTASDTMSAVRSSATTATRTTTGKTASAATARAAGAPDPAASAPDLEAAGAVPVAPELAYHEAAELTGHHGHHADEASSDTARTVLASADARAAAPGSADHRTLLALAVLLLMVAAAAVGRTLRRSHRSR